MGVEAVMTNMTTGTVGGAIPPPAAPEPTAQEVLATAEAPPVEAPKVEEVPAPKERSSEKFAALARKEAEIFRKQQAVRQQQQILAQQAEQLRAFEQAKRAAKLNPLDALKQMGLTYEELTEYVLNDNKPTPTAEVQSVRQELEEYKRQAREEQERLAAQQKQAALAEQQRIVEDFRNEVNEYVAQHAETYELTSLYGGANLVSEVIEEHFRQSGKLMNVAEAAKLVEEHYEDLARKAQATKKFAATQQKAASPQAQTQASAPRMGPTLTNDLTANVAAKAQSPRSDAERIAAAIARLEGR